MASEEMQDIELQTQLLLERSHITKKGRRTVYVGRNAVTSHEIWNLHFPDDPVLPGEVIHHENEDKLDDRIENYIKETKKEHDLRHKPARTAALKKKLTGVPRTEEVKQKIREKHLGKVLSDDHRAKLSESHKGNRPTEETKAKMARTQTARREAELMWSPEEALRLKKMGVGPKEIGRRLGVTPGNIRAYFNRRGLCW